MTYEGRYGKQRHGLLNLRKLTECRLPEVRAEPLLPRLEGLADPFSP